MTKGTGTRKLCAKLASPVEHLRCDGLVHGFYGMEHLSPAVAAATGRLHTALRKLLA
ncbi:hypothetical protein OG216_00445 [Streptomycetaceae bacterium NBC_01309]